MAYNVSLLSDYFDRNSQKVSALAVNQATSIAHFMAKGSVMNGVKGSSELQLMSNTVAFVDGTSCGRVVGAGATALSARKVTVSYIRENMDLCYKALYNTVFQQQLRLGQAIENHADALEAAIAADRAAILAFENEKGIWQGDKSLPSGNLKWYDGILTIAIADGVSITPTGSDIIAKLQSVASQLWTSYSAEVEQEDFYVYIGAEKYNDMKLALYGKNFYAPGSDSVIPGTAMKLFVATGLNGTGKIVATRASNIVLAFDDSTDANKAVVKFNENDEKLHMDFAWALGVQIVRPDHVFYASI